MLTKIQKEILKDFIEEQEVDVQYLDSYTLTEGMAGSARLYEPDEEDWDEQEEYNAKCEKALEKINREGLWEWTDIDDKHKEDAIEFIERRIR